MLVGVLMGFSQWFLSFPPTGSGPAVHLVPMHAEFLGHGIHCAQPWREHYDQTDPHYWYAFNLEDPNHRGYDALRRLFLIEIARRADVIAGKE